MNFGDIPYFSSQYTLNSFVKNIFFLIFDKNIVHFVKKNENYPAKIYIRTHAVILGILSSILMYICLRPKLEAISAILVYGTQVKGSRCKW